MKLRRKVIVLLTGLFAILGAALLLVQQRILLPSFAELERDSARTDMERVNSTLAHDLDLLYSMTADWGNWDATYKFMLDHNTAFIKASMTVSAMQGFKADAVALVDPSGKFVWSAAIAPGSGLPMDLDIISRGALPADHVWQSALRTGKGVRGLLRTNRGPMFAAFAPVLDGDGKGPYHGMILLGRLITDEEIARIGAQAQVKLSRATDRLSGPSRATQADSLVERDTVTEITHVFDDVAGSAALALRIEVPRLISARGRHVVAYASFCVIAAALTVLLAMIVVLNRAVLSPLTRMTRHAVTIGGGEDLTLRLNLERGDELGDLAREFDRMVAKLADSRRHLVDRSFDAGVAENASGVLHNLGNAMTPLGVDVAALQEKLRDAPTADINLVLAEIESARSSGEPTTELEAYLRLTSRELAETLTSAQLDLDAIARTTQSIQAMLSAQGPRARSERVYETILLPELIERSAALVPPKSRQQLSIDLDASLQAVGSVRVPRTTLQQVFQNLILNAAEAVRDAGHEHGTLRIEARVLGDPGGERLHVTFADDGVGIRERDLRRIFEKGFSTKPSSTNSGIGLHWSATAVAALGGEIRAESPGPLGGAIFHMILPLQAAGISPLTQAA